MKFATTFMLLWVAFDSIQADLQAAKPIPLRAGPVSMVFDAENVFLRYIRVGADEVLRGINAPVRNASWSTVPPQVSNLRVDDRGDSFRVTFDVLCKEAEIDFRWSGTISGNSDGDIEFTFEGKAHSTFERNRIGFCVLHGPQSAGKPWTLELVDGTTAAGRFPKLISPHQPAKNLKAITHEVTAGLRARVQFEGEVFEMEDQRNWTDASFKTYCTPLELPYPVTVVEGTTVSQKVKISLVGNRSNSATPATSDTILTLGENESALPRLGVQVSQEVKDLNEIQLKRLKALHLEHLRINLALSSDSFAQELRRASEQAKALGVSLHVGLTLGESPSFNTLLSEIRKQQPPVSHWLVTGGDPTDFRVAREHVAPIAGKSLIGVTRITNFVDLNRSRPEDKTIEAAGFAINPQIHAFDNDSMVETLPIHSDVVRSTRAFLSDHPLIIGPITLRPQLVNGEVAPGGPPAGRFPTYVDVRQADPFTAVWTLGSIKYLAEAGADSATYYETVGWNGVMDADDEVKARPAAFPSRRGELFSVYHLLREIGEFAGGQVKQMDSSHTLRAVGLALHKSGRTRVLLGNLTDQTQTVTLRGLSDPLEVQFLEGERTRATPEMRLSLPPYGIARIDRVAD